MRADVVVIGSGIGGLTAATLLARRGKHVVLLEKQKYCGGSIRRFKRNRIGFDVGFHYTGCLGDGEILDLLWKYCNVREEIPVTPVYPQGYDSYEFLESDANIRGYFSYDRLERELSEHFPKDREGIRRYLSEIRAICDQVPFYNTSLPLTSFLRGYKTRPRSLTGFLQSITENDRLRSVLEAPAFLYGVPIGQCTLETHALVAHGYYAGAYTVSGGGQAIVDAFLTALQREGAQILSGSEAKSIVIEHDRITGVEISGGEVIPCSDVIFTGHPANLLPMIPSSVFRPAYRKRLKSLKNSLSMYAVFGHAERNVKEAGDALNYYLLPEKGEVIPMSHRTPPSQRPIMLTAASGYHEETLQSKLNGIILLRLGYWHDVAEFEASGPGARPDRYEQYKSDVASEMLETANKRWGHLCGKIEPLAVGTPLTFRDELAAPEGCAYGAMHCLDQFNPDVRTRLPGLYLGGQSTLMTGVVGASISGFVAAGEILGLEPFWESLRKWV